MKLARWVFLVAGVVGLLPVVQMIYGALINGETFLLDFANMGLFFYVAVFQYGLWQVLFIILATDPVRYRPMMIVAIFVEVTAALNPAWLYLYGFIFWIPVVFVNLAMAILFLVAFWFTRRQPHLGAA